MSVFAIGPPSQFNLNSFSPTYINKPMHLFYLFRPIDLKCRAYLDELKERMI